VKEPLVHASVGAFESVVSWYSGSTSGLAETMSFFCQAVDGIRVFHVTGVQTCALPICMADGDTTLLAERLDPAGAEQDDDGADHPDPAVPSGLVASLKSFAAAH